MGRLNAGLVGILRLYPKLSSGTRSRSPKHSWIENSTSAILWAKNLPCLTHQRFRGSKYLTRRCRPTWAWWSTSSINASSRLGLMRRSRVRSLSLRHCARQGVSGIRWRSWSLSAMIFPPYRLPSTLWQGSMVVCTTRLRCPRADWLSTAPITQQTSSLF